MVIFNKNRVFSHGFHIEIARIDLIVVEVTRGESQSRIFLHIISICSNVPQHFILFQNGIDSNPLQYKEVSCN